MVFYILGQDGFLSPRERRAIEKEFWVILIFRVQEEDLAKEYKGVGNG